MKNINHLVAWCLICCLIRLYKIVVFSIALLYVVADGKLRMKHMHIDTSKFKPMCLRSPELLLICK